MAQQETTLDLHIAEGEDESKVLTETKSLLDNGWILDEDRAGLRKTYNFPTYAKALDLILMSGIESKLRNHHAELRNAYKTVSFHWTTHRPQGLSSKDTHMAKYCDDQASRLGVIVEEKSNQDAAKV